MDGGRQHLPFARFTQDARRPPLPFAAASFDAAYALAVFTHLGEDLAHAWMDELARVLRPGGHLLVTDFHPDAVAYGWRTACWDGCTTYRLPNVAHTRADYVEAAEEAGFDVPAVLDIPIRDLPAEYETSLSWEHANLNCCLVLLGRKRPTPGRLARESQE